MLGNSPFFVPFWGIFGYFDAKMHDKYGLGIDTAMPTTVVVPVLLWLYLFLVLVVLVNLLIAQMSDTYARITGEGLQRWQFERAQLIGEFKDTKPPLPPPLNVLWFALYTFPQHVYIWYLERFRDTRRIGSVGFKLLPKQQDLNAYQALEEEALRRCLQQREKRDSEQIDARVDKLLEGMQKLEEDGRANFEALNGRLDDLASRVRI